MADVKQILVIDDHFDMLEFLRSMLELSGQDYEVLAVPSAEEGLLELHRTSFDLLIADARLPGMSGFDLVRRVRRQNPIVPVIMITAYSTPEGKREASDLGVYRYFSKPLDTDAVLSAVYDALYGETAEPPPEPVVDVEIPEPDTAVSEAVQGRLRALRRDTGAAGLLLARLDGEVLCRVGGNLGLETADLAKVIARNVENNFQLAGALGGDIPFTLQYHAGQDVELYNANVGRDFFVSLLFDTESRRGRIGTIWVFAQRAIKDLLGLLSAPETAVAIVEEAGAEVEAAAEMTRTPPETAESTVPDEIAASVEEDVGGDEEAAAVEETEETEADLDGLLAALNLDEDAVEVDLDAFWNEVDDDETLGIGSGMSFEEARRQGLISIEEDQ